MCLPQGPVSILGSREITFLFFWPRWIGRIIWLLERWKHIKPSREAVRGWPTNFWFWVKHYLLPLEEHSISKQKHNHQSLGVDPMWFCSLAGMSIRFIGGRKDEHTYKAMKEFWIFWEKGGNQWKPIIKGQHHLVIEICPWCTEYGTYFPLTW